MAALMTITEAANFLGVPRSAIQRRIKQGILYGGQLPGAGVTGRVYVETSQIIGMVKVRRDIEAFEPKTPYVDRMYQVRYEELVRRVEKLQQTLGGQPIRDVLLKKYGIENGEMWRLHPDKFGTFRGDLSQMTQGYMPKYRKWTVEQKAAAEAGRAARRAEKAQGLGRFDALILAGEA